MNAPHKVVRFTGTPKELESRLEGLDGHWNEVNPNQFQFRCSNGAVMNWYPSTGIINFQGKAESAKVLKSLVTQKLEQIAAAPTPQAITRQNDRMAATPTSKVQAGSPLEPSFDDTELVVGLVAATGTDVDRVAQVLMERFTVFDYRPKVIKISQEIIAELYPQDSSADYRKRMNQLMDAGNELRRTSGDNSVLALAASARINQIRLDESPGDGPVPLPRRAFIVSSLKHPEEVHRLRSIYSTGFFLVGVHADEKRRFDFLTRNKQVSVEDAQQLMGRDAEESEHFGQHTRDTFHLSDFFVSLDSNADKLQGDLWRILDLLFGKPYVTPTFDEYAMFMAFSAALRSADLSRQVGAVVTQRRNIVATGANDVPKAKGGLYWPQYNEAGTEIIDQPDGRDYMRGFDSNAREKSAIIDDIVASAPAEQHDKLRQILRRSRLDDITEYGRMVHAEMEAILACTRMGISTEGAVLYCTTFPCHNCAKHIIAAGIERVMYVEPYPKSKALEFHSDSVSLGTDQVGNVVFAPFVGVGPRSFFNLFSTRLGSGYPIERKTRGGEVVDWKEKTARIRMRLLPSSYIERETLAASLLDELLDKAQY